MTSRSQSSSQIAKRYASSIQVDAMRQILAGANDIALVIDRKGVVRDVAAEHDKDILSLAGGWVGSPWIDTVTTESRPKVESILRATETDRPSRWRHLNHPSPSDGPDLPVMYRAFGLGEPSYRIVMGRDLRPMSSLQQQLLDVQQSIERDYARLYHAETRYRMLFQVSSEAVLIVDAGSGQVIEANPAAAALFDQPVNKVIGQPLAKFFARGEADALAAMQARLSAAGKPEELTGTTRDGDSMTIAATFLRHDSSPLALLRLHPAGTSMTERSSGGPSVALEVMERSPDAFVITDLNGRILTVNDAFISLCQVASELQLVNQPLDQWVGRPGVDVDVLRKNLKQRGEIRHFATRINPEYGASVDVELSAVAVKDGELPCLGFVIRHVMRPARSATMASQPMVRTLEQMTELVGQVPMKDLVRETTDIIERMCIEAALKLTTNNRASAADMLGLSRQSLYVKLNRYGIGEPRGDDAA
ncbi:MAG: transcriptional regulator PpsR [Pseudomonadota bacterium]